MIALNYSRVILVVAVAPFKLLFRACRFVFSILKSLFGRLRSLFHSLKDHVHAVQNGPENPKPLFKRSRTSASLCCLFHLIPVLVTLALVALNLLRFFIGRELDGPTGQDGIKLGVLQIAAKVHELFIIASLGIVIFDVVRYELVSGAGLPLGLVGVGFSFSSPSFFITSDFWAGVFSDHPSSLRKTGFITLVAISGLIALFSGPASAVLMIPRELEWKAGRSDLWLKGTKDQIWPSSLDKAPPSYYDDLFNKSCLTSNLWSIRDNYQKWLSSASSAVPSLDVKESTVGMGYARRVYVRTPFGETYIGGILKGATWVSTAHDSVGLLQASTYLSWSNALSYLAETGSVWEYPNYFRLSNASSKTATAAAELPVVRVKCLPFSKIALTGEVLGFPVLAEYDDDARDDLQIINVTDVIHQKLRENPEEYGDQIRSWILAVGVQLPPHPGQSASLGVILISLQRRVPLPRAVPMQTCSIDARWAKGKSFIRETTTSIQTVSINDERTITIESELEDFISSTSFSPPKDGTWRRVEITTDWFNQLTPRELVRNYDEDTSLNQTIVESILTPLAPFNKGKTTITALRKVEFALGLVFADGMSQCFCYAPHLLSGQLFPFSFVMANPVQMRSIAKDLFKLDNLRPPNADEQIQVKMSLSLKGHAMAAVGWFDILSIILLLAHVVIALGHVLVLLCLGKHFSAWESIPELLALALNSEPPERDGETGLENTSVGIKTFGPRQQMGWVETIEDNTVTTGADANQAIRIGQLQLRFGKSRLGLGKPAGMPRVKTGRVYR